MKSSNRLFEANDWTLWPDFALHHIFICSFFLKASIFLHRSLTNIKKVFVVTGEKAGPEEEKKHLRETATEHEAGILSGWDAGLNDKFKFQSSEH